MVADPPRSKPLILPAISALDARLTGSGKAGLLAGMLAPGRHFLLAETEKGALAGFIAGEIRAWEFGQPPAGWVFAIQIDPGCASRASARRCSTRWSRASRPRA